MKRRPGGVRPSIKDPSAKDGNDVAGAPAHYLHPCAVFVTTEPHIVTTVLGSCVSVCLWDRERRAGGINHFMLPSWSGLGKPSPKFGDIAIADLIERMERLDCKRANLVAKVFGGKTTKMPAPLTSVGKRNAEMAEKALGEARIEIVACNIGGPFGLKLLFMTGTGEVLVKRIPNTKPAASPSRPSRDN